MLSVLIPKPAVRLADAVPFAEAARRSGGRLWAGESFGLDTHGVFGALAGAGFHIPMGTAIALMALRHPYESALRARTLAQLTGQPFVAGIGPGAPEVGEVFAGGRYRSARRAAGEYAGAVRTLLAGGVPARGEYVNVTAMLAPIRTPAVEVGLGVLRPRMARTAGAVADVAITWMTPAAYVRDVLAPELRVGAEQAGRPAPPRICAVVHVGLTGPGRHAGRLALAAAGEHLTAPHYARMLRGAGVTYPQGDAVAGARALVSGGGYLHGDPAEVAGALAAYRAAGVDEVVLNVFGVLATHGAAAALSDLERIITAATGGTDASAADAAGSAEQAGAR